MHDYRLTYIRMASLFSIITFHCLCYYSTRVPWPFHGSDSPVDSVVGTFFVSFALPFYVIISGTLAGGRNLQTTIREELARKFRRLIVPYISWTIIQIPLFFDYMNIRTIFTGSFHLWFLLMLFWCYVFYLFSKKKIFNIIEHSPLLGFILILALFFVCKIFSRNTTEILCLRFFFQYLPFFLFGILIGKHQPLIGNRKYFAWSILVISIICFLLTCYGKTYLQTGGTICSVFMDISLVFVFLSVYSILPNKENAIACWIEKQSLGVYIIHHIVIWGVLASHFSWLLQDKTQLGPLILFFVCTPTAFVLTWIIGKIRVLKNCLL